MIAFLDKAVAIMRRDLLIAIRHRAGFLITLAGASAELAAFYFLSQAIGPSFRPEGVEYFPFVLVGTGFYTFLVMGINSFVTTVQEAQQTGTLEVLMSSSTSPAVLVFLSALSGFAGNVLQLVFYLGGGLWLARAELPQANIAGCFLVLLLSLAIAMEIGLFAVSVQIAIQKGSAIVWMLGSGLWFLTGALFPVGTLPKPLQLVSTLLPVTHSLTGLRQALLQGAGIPALRNELAILLLFTVVLLPLSLLTFSFTLRQARQQGTL